VRRRPLLLLAAAVVPVVVLVGCGKSSGDAGATGASTSTSTSTSSDAPSPSGTWSGELPTVDGAYGTESTISMPKGAAPTDLQVKVLKEGDGATLEKGQLAVVKYVGAIWNTGKVFDSSFAHGGVVGFPIGVGQVIAGWDEGLVGQKVGSRVLLVIPPDKGYGAAGRPASGINGTDTLVFVVDILDVA